MILFLVNWWPSRNTGYGGAMLVAAPSRDELKEHLMLIREKEAFAYPVEFAAAVDAAVEVGIAKPIKGVSRRQSFLVWEFIT
jgi:hypothetical protein